MDRSKQITDRSSALVLAQGARVLIIEAPYYAAVSDFLVAGALHVLAENGCSADRTVVPGALEIPQALALAVDTGLIGNSDEAHWQGVIALGCVIRGETSHYDIVCNNANHWLMDTAMRNAVPLGNGILTVDTEAQAFARAAAGAPSGKGGDAARACLRLIALAQQLRQQKKAGLS